MPSTTADAPHGDELDALFDNDLDINDVRKLAEGNAPLSVRNDTESNTVAPVQSNLDEEIVVTKKRQPIAKLDEARILSARGITKLRQNSKKMRYKGKGHEFSDMSRLLSMYQIWLDELYPRAKFADGLAMIEKLGHKKRMQVMRKGWIDEGKPRFEEPEQEPEEEPDMPAGTDTAGRASNPGNEVLPPRDGSMVEVGEENKEGHRASDGLPLAEPDADELDALMAENASNDTPERAEERRDMFADDEEAMAGIDW